MKRIFTFLFLTLIYLNINAQNSKSLNFVDEQIEHLGFALKYYQAIEKSDNWRYLRVNSDSIHSAIHNPQIKALLRNNLCITGDLPEMAINIHASEEDSALFYSLKHFQYRHGLAQTGNLNTETLAALNTPICDRIDQIRTNLKRWEQVLLKNENLFVMVNIPDYSLKVIKNGKVDLSLKVIVGKPTTPTPQFYDEIEQIVVNPSWSVPRSIVKFELYEKIKKDPQYLKKHNLKLITYGRKGKAEIKWEDINWENSSPETFNYSIEQIPGATNALGSIKFNFPNNNEIYIHDTPEKKLFNTQKRAYSHGCIRVQNPEILAEYLLNETTNIGKGTLKNYLSKDKTKVIPLTNPVPVSLAYFTSFIDEELSVHFREDIYHMDLFEEEELDLLGKLLH